MSSRHYQQAEICDPQREARPAPSFQSFIDPFHLPPPGPPRTWRMPSTIVMVEYEMSPSANARHMETMKKAIHRIAWLLLSCANIIRRSIIFIIHPHPGSRIHESTSRQDGVRLVPLTIVTDSLLFLRPAPKPVFSFLHQITSTSCACDTNTLRWLGFGASGMLAAGSGLKQT